MTVATAVRGTVDQASGTDGWYSVASEEVGIRLGVDPTVGLSSEQAADLLDRHGSNSLPVEQAVPGWRRFLGQYRSYMQMILVGAAVVSPAIKEWNTGVLLLALWETGKLVARRLAADS
jgi:Ca2+-transporting ATPase